MIINKKPFITTTSLLMLALSSSVHAAIQNPGFESGDSDWDISWNGKIISKANNINSGAKGSRIGVKSGDDGAIEQIVTGLTPNTDYELSAYVKVKSSSTINIGVKDYGYAEAWTTSSSGSFTKVSLQFSTGPSNTTATIYGYRSAGTGYVYADDFELVNLSGPSDTTAPTVSLSSSEASPTAANTIPVTITFSEEVTNFDASDLVITNGTASNFSANAANTEWTVDITPTASGDVNVSIAADSAEDLAGNLNIASNAFSIEYAPAPVATNLTLNPSFESGDANWNTSWNASVVSSESVEGSHAVRVGNGAAAGAAEQVISGLTPNTLYRLSASGRVDDASSQLDIGVKFYGGVQLYTPITSTNYQTISIDFTTGATDTSATIYAYRALGSAYGFADDFSVIDVAGGTPPPVDTTDPTLIISSTEASPTFNSPIPVTVTFSEEVTDFDETDVIISNGSISNFVANAGNTVWTMDVTPYADGAVDVNVAVASAFDLAGNYSEASNLFSIEYYAPVVDTTAPTVNITSSAGSSTTLSPIPVTVSFNEDVTGFSSADLIISNGTVSNFTTTGANVWTMDITPVAAGNVDISIAAAAADDLAGNASEASNLLSISYSTAPTGENLVPNGGFEDGVGNWDDSWQAQLQTGGTEAYEGQNAMRFGTSGEGGAIEKDVTGLKPSTIYELTVYGRLGDTNTTFDFGVKDYDSANNHDEHFDSFSSTTYTQKAIRFTTGQTDTSAHIFAWRGDAATWGGGLAYVDNFSIVEIGPAPVTQPDPETPTGGCYTPETSSGNSNYYVDSAAGDDCNDGLTPATAWQSLHKPNTTTFNAGDQILLKDNGIWTGVLKPLGSGVAGNHIVLGKYGSGGSEQRPIINGNGTEHAVFLHNQEYFEITNLEVINSAEPDAKKRGIEVLNTDAGILHQIHIKNNYVHDIDGDNTKDTDGSAGIMVTVRKGSSPVMSNYDGIYIENNAVVRADRTAINTSSAWWCRPSVGCNDGTGYKAHTNVIVRNNYVEDAGGDGIVPINSESALVEYNLVNGANINSKMHNVAIWTWNADNTLFQNNEAYNTQETVDGQGFDVDYGQDGTIFQYNYSHDNVGGFMLVATSPTGSTTNTIIRYNVSQNDYERIFHIAGQADGMKIYNNTLYLPAGSVTKPILVTEWGGAYPANIEFYNNIFHLDGAGDWEGIDNVVGNFIFDSSNIVYGSHTAGEPNNAIDVNPLLVAPGTATTGTYTNGALTFGNFDGYKLQTGSPAIGTGVVIPGAPSVDFWGNAVSATAPNIGAYAGSGE